MKLVSITYILFVCIVTASYCAYSIYSNTVQDSASEYTFAALTSNSQSGLLYSNVTFTGQLLLDGVGASGKTVYLMRSPDEAAWTSIGSTTTGVNGVFQFEVNRTQAGTFYYKARFDVP